MSLVRALSVLYTAVKAEMTSADATLLVSFGWREPAKHLVGGNGPRIAFVPGDPQGSMGEDRPARNPGRLLRPIATLGELFTVYLSACDSTAPEDELKQYTATADLYDRWRAAMYHAARGTFEIQSTDWNIEKKERRFGAQIICVCSLDAMIPDTTESGEDLVGAEITAGEFEVETVTTIDPPVGA